MEQDDPPLFDRISDLEAWLVEYRVQPNAELGWITELAERLPSGHVMNRGGSEVELSTDIALYLLWNIIQVVNRDGLSESEALQQIQEILADMGPSRINPMPQTKGLHEKQ